MHELTKTINVSRGIGFNPSLTSLRTNRNSINLQMANILDITNACVNKVCIVLNTSIYLFIQLRIKYCIYTTFNILIYNMRKIEPAYENFIDSHLIDICEYMSDYVHNMGITPNIITTLSVLFGLSAAVSLYKYRYYTACISWSISYYLDNLDGYVARKYNQTSTFGDYYDHFSDLTKFLTVWYILYLTDSRKFYIVSIVLCIFSLLMLTHLGCQEKYYDKNESQSLDFTKDLCPVTLFKTLPNTLNITKYFGCGTFNLVIALCFLYYKF